MSGDSDSADRSRPLPAAKQIRLQRSAEMRLAKFENATNGAQAAKSSRLGAGHLDQRKRRLDCVQEIDVAERRVRVETELADDLRHEL